MWGVGGRMMGDLFDCKVWGYMVLAVGGMCYRGTCGGIWGGEGVSYADLERVVVTGAGKGWDVLPWNVWWYLVRARGGMC